MPTKKEAGMLSILKTALRALLRRQQAERELDEEVRHHIEQQIGQNVRLGMNREEAAQAALKSFGGVEQAKERSRDARGVRWLEELWQDLRYGARMLVKNPDFTLVAVITLALGIGANTTIFSLIDAVLLKRLPVERPEQLFFIDNVGARGGGGSPPYPCFEQFRNRSQSFTGISAFSTFDSRINVDGQLESVKGQYVSGNYFTLLGVKAILGRTFSPADDSVMGQGGPDGPVMVISYNYWTRRFGQSQSVIGKVVNVGNSSVTIIGVASPEFFGLRPGVEVNIALPMMLAEPGRFDRSNRFFDAIGRLKAGVSVERARAELDGIYQAFIKDSSSTAEDRWDYFARIELTPASRGLDTLRRQYSQPLRMLMIVVTGVLLIACANVANLLLARASSRQKEFALRLALGSSRARLVRQLLTESLLLVALGGLAGLLIARWCSAFLVNFFASGISPISIDLPLDGRVLLFTAGLSLLTVLIFGTAPALQSARVDLNPILKDSASTTTSTRSRLRGGKPLIIFQIALSLVLLIGAGLFLRTLQNLKKLDPGFNRERVLTMYLGPPEAEYQRPRLSGLWLEILRRVETIPGVRSASVSQLSPLSGHDRGALIKAISGLAPKAGGDMRIRLNHVSPGYFTTMGIAVLQGRSFTESDNESAPKVALFNETASRHYFDDRNPIGARLTLMNETYEIVGVVRDSKHNSLRDDIPRLLYLPALQPVDRLSHMFLALRTDSNPTDFVSAVRNEIRAAGTGILITKITTLSEQVDQSLLQERLISMLSIVFGSLALLLACIGLYGVMSYDVLRRKQEIGVRMALGAQTTDVLKLIVKQGMALALIGVGIGIVVSLALTRLLKTLLFGVSATDAMTFTAIALLLSLIALLACWIPARRATKVDPMVALRCE
jgi:putative ABC transport system permease protein